MRKVTKKNIEKHRKTRTRTRPRAITKINIKHNKGRGPDDPAYKEAVDKITVIFGKKILENAIKYGNAEYIQKLIDLIETEKSKHSTNISNREQITQILHPALKELLKYIRDDYYLIVPFIGKTHPLQLVIPRVVSVDTVLTSKRIENILTIAETKNLVEDQLIEEFIKNLKVLKSGFKSSVVVSDLPSLPPPPPPRQSSYKSPRRSKSPRTSKSPYTPRRSKSPVSIVVTPVSQRNPDAIRVSNVLILGRGKNYKKTRRRK